MQRTLKLTLTWAKNVSVASIKILFQTYSSEVVDFASHADSPSKMLNADVRAISQVANTWAWIGYQTISDGAANLGPWKIINYRVTKAFLKLTNDLKNGR